MMTKTEWIRVTNELPTKDIVDQYPVVVVKNQNLNNQDLIDFVKTLGRIWDDEKFSPLQQTLHRGKSVNDNAVVNVSHDGTLGRKLIPWHQDLSHYPIQYVPNRLLYSNEHGNETPTVFFNTTEALWRNPDILQYLRNFSAFFKAPYDTPWNWPVHRPVVYKHPGCNKLWSFSCPGVFGHEIIGPEKRITGTKQCMKWVSEIVDYKLFEEDLIYEHYYEKGDLVIYNNHSVIHRRNSFDHERTLKRVTWEIQ